MSFIKGNASIDYTEAVVLRFALQKILPHFENVVADAKDDRKKRAVQNLESAREMLNDLEESLDTKSLV